MKKTVTMLVVGGMMTVSAMALSFNSPMVQAAEKEANHHPAAHGDMVVQSEGKMDTMSSHAMGDMMKKCEMHAKMQEMMNNPEMHAKMQEMMNNPEMHAKMQEMMNNPEMCAKMQEMMNDPEMHTKMQEKMKNTDMPCMTKEDK